MSTRARRVGIAIGVAALAVALVIAWWLARRDPEPTTDPATPDGGGASPAAIAALCARCHAPAPPEILPRFVWRPTIETMFAIAETRDGIVDGVPLEAAVAFYERGAPDELPLAKGGALDPGGLAFEPRGIAPRGAPPLPAIANVRFADIVGDARPELIACDMRHGAVFYTRPWVEGDPLTPIAKLPHPARAHVVDLDGDGARDLLVADLGSFEPGDHARGRAVWLRRAESGRFDQVVLLEDVGRVADVRAGDIDGDGDLDVVVAAFGFRKVGGIYLLENEGPGEDGLPRFTPTILDTRAGAIDVPIVDVDGDGRLDVVALFAQEHETVVAFRNTGGLALQKQVVYAAPHPDWGCSGIDLADLDGDGDLDVVLANGDTLDSHVLKPDHGVRWLENRGAFPFVEHGLAAGLYGVHRAEAADLDGDGDLDIVAVCFLPQFATSEIRAPLALDSVVWFEQTAPGAFTMRPLQKLACDHPSATTGDVDGDGDIDIAIANFTAGESGAGAIPAWVELWVNRAR